MHMLRMFVFPLNAMVAVYRVARGCRSDVSWNSGFPCSYLQTAYAFHYGLPTLEPARHPLCESLQKNIYDVDQMVKENLSFFQDSSVDREEHDTLFYLKSLDLDMRMHYKLGTIYACGREHRACA